MRIVACLLMMAFGAGVMAQTNVDYDANDNNLIDVRTQAQLQAITHDLTGAGTTTHASYVSAFPNRMSGMGCPATCAGYELLNDITLSGDWIPIGGIEDVDDGVFINTTEKFGPFESPPADIRYRGTFEGNGYVITGLNTTHDTGGKYNDVGYAGLFRVLDTGGIIRNVGLVNPNMNLEGGSQGGSGAVGALVGVNHGEVAASYAVGGLVRSDIVVGGLVGRNEGTIIASYANVRVTPIVSDAGGLTASNGSSGRIIASYALGAVVDSGHDDDTDRYGGLVGENATGGQITDSYSASDLSGHSSSGGAPASSVRVKRDLHLPTAATGIFANWGDYPWDFGRPFEYPALRGVSARFPVGNAAGIAAQRQRHPAPAAATLATFFGPRGPAAEGSAAKYTVELNGSIASTVSLDWEVELTGTGSGFAVFDDFETTRGTVSVTTSSRVLPVMTRADETTHERVEFFRVRVANLRGVSGLSLSGAVISTGAIASGGEDYDADDNGLIDVTTMPQLNALRYDASGAGIVGATVADAPAYEEAFAFFDPNLTCPDGCHGYELLNDLDFNTGDAATRSDDLYWNGGLGWEPINYGGTFDGNGYVLSNLYIDNDASGGANRGLFGALMRGGVIRGVGLVNATIESGGFPTGALAGLTAGGSTVTSSYAVGGSVDAEWGTGGLVGFHTGAMVACYAAVAVTGSSVGSLVGSIGGVGRVIASYGIGRVHTTIPNLEQRYRYGGLIGSRDGRCGSCRAFNSYYDLESTGWSHSNEGTSKTTSELRTPVGYDDVAGNDGQAIYAAWNVDLSGDGTADDPWDFGTPLDYPVLRGVSARFPAGNATAIRVQRQWHPDARLATLWGPRYFAIEGSAAEYRVELDGGNPNTLTLDWEVELTGVGAEHAAFADFDTMSGTVTLPARIRSVVLPVMTRADGVRERTELFRVRVSNLRGGPAGLRLSASSAVVSAIASQGEDYDGDGDGLIDVVTTAQLDALRYDLNGVGIVGVALADVSTYQEAFAFFDPGMTCPDGCAGYELANDLDLSGAGNWTPLGGGFAPQSGNYNVLPPVSIRYRAIFEGNGYVIRNMAITRSSTSIRYDHVGLFGVLGANGVIRSTGLVDVNVDAPVSVHVGALAGYNFGKIAASYVAGSGRVRGAWAVGGLVGSMNGGTVIAGYSSVEVESRDATSGGQRVGALIGNDEGGASVVSASYTTGDPTGGGSFRGGLLGFRQQAAAGVVPLDIQSSYFDGERSGESSCCGTNPPSPDNTPQTSAELRVPTTTAGTLYAGWDRLNVNDADENNDGDYNDDAPWDFGTFIDYPVLRGADAAVARRQFLLQDPVTLAVTLTGPVTVFEGDTAEYTVRAPYALPYAATVRWSVAATTAANAVAAGDFSDGAATRLARLPSGAAAIAAGGSTTTFSVSIFDDRDEEPAERFLVRVDHVEDAGGGRIVWSTGNSSVIAAAIELSDSTDYDLDDDLLIDVATTSQLSAIRYDLGGVGLAGVSDANRNDYLAAFALFDAAKTCPTTCTGYELLNDLDLSSAGDWTPLGKGADQGGDDAPANTHYQAIFDGNGYVIRNMRIAASGANNYNHAGLFSALGSRGQIRSVGMVAADVNISGRDSVNAGALAGVSHGRIAASYAVGGTVRGYWVAGGLAGRMFGDAVLIASYTSMSMATVGNVSGGLVGAINGGVVSASYAIGRMSSAQAGGLAGERNGNTGEIQSSYFDSERSGRSSCCGSNPVSSDGDTPRRSAALSTPTAPAGIYAGWDRLNVNGVDENNDGDYNDDAPWDFGTFIDYPVLRGADAAVARRQFLLQDQLMLAVTLTGPVSLAEGDTAEYTVHAPIALPYAATVHWSVAAATGANAAAAGDFSDGAAMRLTRLPSGAAVIAADASTTTFSVSIFDDGDRELAERFSVRVDHVEDAGGGRIVWSTGNSSVVAAAIELSDGINHDPDGNGLINVATTSQLSAIRYDLGGRGLAGVRGDGNRAAYLAAFAFFSEAQTCSGTCTGYELLNDLDLSSAGNWTPIGNGWGGNLGGNHSPISYKATFEGNGHVISNLRIDVSHRYIGLFSALGGSNGVIRNVGLVDVNVSGGTIVGALVGWNAGGTVATSYVVGGVVRAHDGFVAGAGGLVGQNEPGTVIACYANVRVGSGSVGASGGLVYFNAGMVIASYSYGERERCASCGGLVNFQNQGHQGVESSYFDGDRGGWGNGTRVPPSTRQNGKTLRSPTTASGIYAGWDRLNVDNTSGTVMGVVTLNDDAPWDFGNTLQYPVLRHGRSAAAVRAQQSSQTLHLTPTLRGDTVVSEGGRARYVVSLERVLAPSGLLPGVSASWIWSAGGGAVVGGDFAGPSSGSVIIMPGAVSASFSLATAVDGVAELDEAFEMSLGDGVLSGTVGDASLGAGSAVRTTIAANEFGQVTVAAESPTVAEGETATFTLRLDGGDGGRVAVHFEVFSASASITPADLGSVTWSDHAGSTSVQVSAFPITGSVTLSAADTATVSVAVATDAVPGESGERFGVRLTRCDVCGNPRPVEIGVPSSAQVTISRTPLTVSAQVYLEGAYISASSGMKTTLAGLLPRSQPYGAAPWNHLAATSVPLVPGRSGLSGVTSTVVDWVLVELRASTPGAGASAALPTTGGLAAGLLLSDGRIAGIGEGALSLDGVPVAAGFAQGSDIYVAIHHRNHLAVMSAQPAATGSGVCGVHYCADFRNVPSYQGCAQSRRAGGVYVMAAGDVNRSGVVSWGDDALPSGANYAVDADLDFDGRLSPADVQIIMANHLLASECTPRRPRP